MSFANLVGSLIDAGGMSATLESCTRDATTSTLVDAYGDPDVSYVTSDILIYIEDINTRSNDWRGFGELTSDDREGFVKATQTINVRDKIQVTTTGRRYEVLAVQPILLYQVVQFYHMLLKIAVE